MIAEFDETSSSSTNVIDPSLLAMAQHLAGRIQDGDKSELLDLERRNPREAEEVRKLLPALTLLAELSESWSPRDEPPLTPDSGLGLLGDFRLIRPIGRGGMGMVYEAVQVSLNRRVAVKVLPVASMFDPRKLKRFEIEAKAAAQLHHTNIVPVYAVGCERGSPYYAMQLIEGRSLADFIRESRAREGLNPDLNQRSTAEDQTRHHRRAEGLLPETREVPVQNWLDGSVDVHADLTYRPPTDSVASATGETKRDRAYYELIATLGHQAAEALEHAHQQGILHRDIKPANLLLDALGRLWVTDFGLARYREGDDLTNTGDILGTLRYMSPEQARSSREMIDGRSDVYSLGITLYELITLHPAFGATDRQELLNQILNHDPPPPSQIVRSVPVDLETIILKAIAKLPADRYTTAQELADDLRRYLDDRPILARRLSLRERLARRARRNMTLLLVVASMLVLSLSVLSVLVLIFNARLQEKNAALWALTQSERRSIEIAEEQRKLAESETQLNARYLQANRLRLAAREWEAGRIERAQEILADLAQKRSPTESFGFPGRYLDAAVHRQLDQLWGHESITSAVASTADHRLLATGDYDSVVLVWDVARRLQIARLAGPQGKIDQIDFSPDGKHLLCSTIDAGSDPVFQLWDVKTSRLLALLALPRATGGRYKVSPDFHHLACNTIGGDVPGLDVWEIPRNGGRFERKRSLVDVTVMSFSPSGDRFAALERNDRLMIHSLAAGREPVLVAEGMEGLAALEFEPDGSTLWAHGKDSGVFSWDLTTSPPRLRSSPTEPVAKDAQLLVLRPKGHPLAIFRDSAGAVRVTDLKCGRSRVLPADPSEISQLSISDSGRWLAVGGRKSPARIWDLHSDAPPIVYLGSTGNIHGLEFLNDRPMVAIVCEHPAVRLWHPRLDAVSPRLADHGAEAWAVVVSGDGKMVYSAGDNHEIRAWDVARRRLTAVRKGHDSLVTSLALDPSGSILASGSFDGTVRLWGLDGESLHPVLRECRREGEPNDIRTVAISAEGGFIAAAGTTGQISVWHFPSGRPLLTLHGHKRKVRSVAISPDGDTLLSGGNDGMLRLWNLTTGETTTVVRGGHEILSVAFSPLGDLAAASRSDGAIMICDPKTLEVRQTLRGHIGEVRSLAFSSDGLTLASGGADSVVKLWDTRTGQDLLCLKENTSIITCLAFAPDGKSLVSAAMNGGVYRWSVDDLKEDRHADRGFDEKGRTR